MGHDHHHGGHHHHPPADPTRAFALAAAINVAFVGFEAIAGLVTGSLALLADAGHMFTDAGALALSLLAMRLAQRPPTPAKTFGYVRLEILAALVNGATLLAIAVFIVREAWLRLHDPVTVDGPVMLTVAVLGLGVNVAGALLLHAHAHDNLNMRGAYLHVLGDLLGSVGAIAAAAIILLTGWTPADPLISVVIAGLILFSAWRLMREATDVLLEAAPPHLDVPEIVSELGEIAGLADVHDVHVWTLTSGFVALSAHGVIDDPAHHGRILEEVRSRMNAKGIGHVTFQLEIRPLYQLPPRARSSE